MYVATTVTITTLVILAAGPKREYPDGGGGVNWGSTNNKCHKQNGLRTLIHWFEHIHNIDHLTKLLMSSYNYCSSPRSLLFLKSIDIRKVQYFGCHCVILSFNLFVHITNKAGPSTELCGTSLEIDFHFETAPPAITLCPRRTYF